MAIALLSGANPKRSSGGPVVRLWQGRYILRVESVQSILGLMCNGLANGQITNGQKLVLSEHGVVQITFLVRGDEDVVSVYAERAA